MWLGEITAVPPGPSLGLPAALVGIQSRSGGPPPQKSCRLAGLTQLALSPTLRRGGLQSMEGSPPTSVPQHAQRPGCHWAKAARQKPGAGEVAPVDLPQAQAGSRAGVCASGGLSVYGMYLWQDFTGPGLPGAVVGGPRWRCLPAGCLPVAGRLCMGSPGHSPLACSTTTREPQQGRLPGG